MKNLLFPIIGFSVLSTATAFADPLPNLPELVTIAPEHVFSPRGFDNNDNAQITIAGNLPSTCFKTGPVSTRVDHATKTVYVKNQAYFYPGCWCLQVLVPFTQTVDLGVLPVGQYQVVAEQGNGVFHQKSTLPISYSTNSGPDDYLYALVDDAQIEPAHAARSKVLTISGILASTCMDVSDVRVVYRDGSVIEVLPKVTLRDEAECAPAKIAFKRKVKLSPNWKGETLVHVRSLNGQALNKITEF